MRKRGCIVLSGIVVLMVLAGCAPITYYLAQVYKVHGTVTDAVTGEPLESVEVFICGTRLSGSVSRSGSRNAQAGGKAPDR